MSKLDFAPIGDRIIVKPQDDAEVKTNSGIIIVPRDNVNKELPQCGEVIAVGNGGTFPDCPDPSKVFQVGDFVYFNRYAGDDVIIGNPLLKDEHEIYKILRLDAVFGKLTNPPTKNE